MQYNDEANIEEEKNKLLLARDLRISNLENLISKTQEMFVEMEKDKELILKACTKFEKEIDLLKQELQGADKEKDLLRKETQRIKDIAEGIAQENDRLRKDRGMKEVTEPSMFNKIFRRKS